MSNWASYSIITYRDFSGHVYRLWLKAGLNRLLTQSESFAHIWWTYSS